jgi:hypothetical protein
MSKKVLDQELLTSSFEEIGSVGLTFIDQGILNIIQAIKISLRPTHCQRLVDDTGLCFSWDLPFPSFLSIFSSPEFTSF